MTNTLTAGARFRAALEQEQPLQIMGAINAYGDCVSKPWMFKQTTEHFEQLNERLCQLGSRDEIKIGLEAGMISAQYRNDRLSEYI